jgi:NADH dehydrogenase/NADH:ubiquinone oxidoreductase subunit G
MSDEAAAGGAGDGAGTTATWRRCGAWNKHDTAAAHDFVAAAKAAGATGISLRYGSGVSAKIWFEPHGPGQVEVEEKVKEVQLATMQARLDELERRDAKVAAQKAKKKERRKNQKAKKAAAATEAEAAGKQNGGDAGAGSRDRPAAAAAEARLESFEQAVAAVTDEAETRFAQRKVAALENINIKPSLGPHNLGSGLNLVMKVPSASVAAQMKPDQLVAILDGCQGCASKRDEAVQLLLSPHDPKATYSGPFAGQLSGMDMG